VEGRGWGAYPERGRQRADRLCMLLLARLQPPRGGFLPRPAILLQLGTSTSCPQLHNCSVDLYSFL
jgi:hypothetical protein